MGIATDIVIQQRHRQKGESGAEELAAELQEAEENFEDIREALRARLFRPLTKSARKQKSGGGTSLQAVAQTSGRRSSVVADFDSHGPTPVKQRRHTNGPTNVVHPYGLPGEERLLTPALPAGPWEAEASENSTHELLQLPALRNNVPAFNDTRWLVINGCLATDLKTPGQDSDALMNSVDQIPQTPSPVRVKRGAIDAEMERRTLDISFSADGTKLAACNTIGQTWVVCLSTGKILHSMRGHKKARVSTCAISPGGGFVASGGSDGRVALWDCRQGSPAYLLGGPDKIPQHKDIKVNGISYGVSNVEISPDGRYLASAGQDGVVLIYQLANGAAVDDLPLAEHVEPKQWLRLPFGDPEEEQSHMALAHAAMHFVGFSMDGSLCAACGAYGRFALVEVDSEKVHDFFLGSEDEAFLHVAFDNVGGLGPPENIAVTSTLGCVYIFSIDAIKAREKKFKNRFMIPGGPITCCAWEPNTAHRNRPQRLAAGSEGGILMVCNVEEDIQVTAIDVGSFGTDNIHTVSYSDDGAFLLVAGLGSKALVIDPDTHAIIHALEPGAPSDPLSELQGSNDDCLTIAESEAVRRKKVARSIMAARFRPSCYHVATALGIKSKGAILLWDINPGAGSTILQVEDGDNEACHPFSRFLGNSRDVMCSTAGGHIQIWSGTMSRLKLHVQLEGFDRDNAAIKAWECAESGGRVMLHMDDDSVAVWDISDAIASANTENLFGSMDTSSTTLQFYSPIATWEMEGCRAQMSPCGGFMVKHGYGPVMVCTTTGDVLGELGLSGGHRPHCHTYNFSNDGSLVIGSSSQSPRLYVWLTSRPPRQVTCLEPMDADNYSLQKDPGCFVDFSIFPVPLASTVGPARGTMALGTGGGWWVAAVASVTSTPGSDEPPSSGVYWWALVNPTPSKIISTSYAYHPDHRPNTCVFSPNGRMLASYGLDGRVIVWELQGRGKNGKVIGNRKLYKGGVEFVSWSSDSQMLAICGLPGASDTTTAPDVAYVACVATGRISACLQARPSCSFAMVSFSPDCRYVAAAHTDGSVGIYTRAGAQDMAPTDFCFYLRNGKRAAGFHTDELVKTLIRHPLMANHVSQEGHNLITSLVLMRDPASLEQLLNLAPRNVPLLSYKTGYWRDGKYKPIDAMSLALQRSDQGILYDLLMAMADGKVTPQSWESLLDSGRDSLDGSGFWMQLCKEFPSLVLVFLTRLNPELLDDDVDFADRQGNLATGEMYVAGSSVYLPECLQSFWRKKTALQMKSWRRQIMEYCKERYRWMTNAGDDEQQVTQKCVSRRVNIPWILRPGERGFLKELVESDCPSAVYGTPVVRAVLQYKWRQFGRRMFAWECFFYVLQLISFTSFALIYSDLEPVPCSKGLHQKPSTVVTDVMNHYKSEQETSVNGYKEEALTIMGIISILVAIRNMYRESLQMWAVGIINYFKDDIWNVLDFASYILIFAIFPLNLFGTPSCPAFFASVASGSAVIDSRPFGLHDLEDLCLSSPDGLSPEMAEACTVYVNASYNIPFLDQLIALEVTFLWLEVLHYASGFRNTAALVRIVIDTIYDIRWFMALQVVLMLGFGAAFAVVFSNQLPCDPENDFCKFNEAYDTIVLSLLSVFGLLLGDISVLDYFNSPNPALSVFLMIVYEFLVSIVLFNMLIALMADTFVNVKEKEELEFLRGRARIICSQEETMQKKQLVSTAIFPRYLHTLELKGDEEFMSALSSIQGQANETRVQLHKIQDSMQENHAKMVKELKRESKSLMGELKAVKPKAHHSKGAVKHPGSTKPPFGRPLES